MRPLQRVDDAEVVFVTLIAVCHGVMRLRSLEDTKVMYIITLIVVDDIEAISIVFDTKTTNTAGQWI
jgi:hypothetical protein